MLRINSTRVNNIFRIESSIKSKKVNDFLDWLDENLSDEQYHVLDHPDSIDVIQNVDNEAAMSILDNGNWLTYFVIHDEASIMAFKLRWL